MVSAPVAVAALAAGPPGTGVVTIDNGYQRVSRASSGGEIVGAAGGQPGVEQEGPVAGHTVGEAEVRHSGKDRVEVGGDRPDQLAVAFPGGPQHVVGG